jgi:hypothetical protein
MAVDGPWVTDLVFVAFVASGLLQGTVHLSLESLRLGTS